MTQPDPYEALIDEVSALDRRAKAIQGDREILVDEQYVDALIGDYGEWYARALSVLPEEFHEKFIDLYEGGFVIKRIRSFLASPGTVSSLWSEDQQADVFPYWDVPYETTFHTSLLEQRQLLTLAKQRAQHAGWQAELDLIVQVMRGFPAMVRALQRRHDDRPALDVDDEYDVQDLLGAVLAMLFGDVRREDPSPIHAGGASRVDFFLKEQQILVEVKMTRPGLSDREVARQLIEDIERYRSHPDWTMFIGFVYDPEHRLGNPRGLETDLSGQRDGLTISVVVSG